MLDGIKITVDAHLCEYPCLGQAKRHRKSRINRKWLKRYGVKSGPCPGKCYEIRGMGLLMCPHIKAELDKVTKLQDDPMGGVVIPHFNPLLFSTI